jgi:four helix bundle protein
MKNDLNEQFINLAISVIRFGKSLNSTFEGRHIYSQLFRSITSSGPNYQESQSAESPPDFVHKLQVSLKELKRIKILA